MTIRVFLQGVADFYMGNKKEVSYSKNNDDLMNKAWKMTGTSLSRMMRESVRITKKNKTSPTIINMTGGLKSIHGIISYFEFLFKFVIVRLEFF